MDFEHMILSENTDQYYDLWRGYRNEVTEHILDIAESYYTKKYLLKTGKKRLEERYGMEEIIASGYDKPKLAIWGAGGCNDIDIKSLSKYFRLILIDHEIDRIETARTKYGLSREECACVDLKFWDISREDYHMIEALIRDGASPSDIKMYIEEIVNSMREPDCTYVDFDISFASGLVSQLNARLAALLYIYKYPYDMSDFLYRLNYTAGKRFISSIKKTTGGIFVLGLEELTQLAYERERLKNEVAKVAGNDSIMDIITHNIEKGKMKLFSRKYLMWNFSEVKSYLMKFCSYEILF